MKTQFAFPQFNSPEIFPEQSGMTLRDYFAAKAMQAMTSDIERVKSICAEARKHDQTYAQEVSVQSYILANAMMKEREFL